MAEELSSEAMIEAVTKDHQASQGQESVSKESSPEIPTDPKSPQLYKYVTSGGREVEEPIEMVLKRAGMGYHYAQQMHQHNQSVAQWNKEQQQFQQRMKELERWEQYDKYAKDNPEWVKHWEGAWDNRLAGIQGQDQQRDPYGDKFKQYDETIQNFKRFMDESLSERQKTQYAQEDEAFDREIQKVAKDFDVDLDKADENGRSLQWQVLDHMEKLGMNARPGQFTAAFKDFYFGNLQDKAKEKALENTSKDKAELKKAGIIDISRSPKGPNTSKGVRPGMSYSEAEQAILAELKAKA